MSVLKSIGATTHVIFDFGGTVVELDVFEDTMKEVLQKSGKPMPRAFEKGDVFNIFQ